MATYRRRKRKLLSQTGGHIGGRAKKSAYGKQRKYLVKRREGFVMDKYTSPITKAKGPTRVVYKNTPTQTRLVNQDLRKKKKEQFPIMKRLPPAEFKDYVTAHRNHHRRKPFKISNKGTIAEDIQPKASFNSPQKNDKFPVVTTRKKVMGSVAGVVGKAHDKMFVETGVPSSKSLMRVKKNNGARNLTLFDSEIGSLTPIGDEFKDRSCGFNSKELFLLPPAAYVNVQDVLIEAGKNLLNEVDRQQELESIYASVLNQTEEFTFHNQSAFLPLQLKIHLIDKEDKAVPDVPGRMLMLNTFHLDKNFSTGLQDTDRIPRAYQYSDIIPIVESSAPERFAYEVHLSNNINPFKESNYFKNNFTVAKTYTKRIEPGSTFEFKHVHHFGSGLDLKSLVNVGSPQKPGRLLPTGYMYMFELCGYPCEAVRQADATTVTSHIGTSPCWYHFEFKKKLNYVRAGTNLNDDITITGATTPMHYRAWTKSHLERSSGPNTDPIVDKIIHGLPSQIAASEASLQVGEFAIPIVTDSVIRYQIPRHQSVDKSETAAPVN